MLERQLCAHSADILNVLGRPRYERTISFNVVKRLFPK